MKARPQAAIGCHGRVLGGFGLRGAFRVIGTARVLTLGEHSRDNYVSYTHNCVMPDFGGLLTTLRNRQRSAGRGSIMGSIFLESAMPHVNIPEETFRRLATKAASLSISVEDLVKPALDQLAETEDSAPETSLPLTGDAWLAELDAWKRDAESRGNRYPRGYILDDSRQSIYGEREDAQL